MAKDKTKDKGKAKGKKGGGAPADSVQPSVSAHPRARRSISRTKAWGGLLTFALVALLSYRAGVPAFEIGVRALAAGIAGYLVAWFAAVALWQRLVVQELKEQTERRRVEHEEALERMKAAQEAAADEVVA